jgi:hypothetical protein
MIGDMAIRGRSTVDRSWERGSYMGADATHPDAVRRHRPREAVLR